MKPANASSAQAQGASPSLAATFITETRRIVSLRSRAGEEHALDLFRRLGEDAVDHVPTGQPPTPLVSEQFRSTTTLALRDGSSLTVESAWAEDQVDLFDGEHPGCYDPDRWSAVHPWGPAGCAWFDEMVRLQEAVAPRGACSGSPTAERSDVLTF